MSNKTWGRTETGDVFHSFNGEGTGLCRKNVKVGRMSMGAGLIDESAVDRIIDSNGHLFRKCASCAKREAEFRARVEASMQPVGEYDQVCEGIEGFGNAAAETEVVETYEVQDETVIVLAGDPAPVDEDEFACIDGDGNVYPEHSEDEWGSECRRCGAELTDEDDEPDVDGAGRTYAEYHPGTRSEAGRTVTQKPVIRATFGEARPAFGSDPLRPPTPEPLAQQPTAEEARAEVVKRFPRGTRVQGPDSSGTWRSGVVNGYDVGTVTEPGHVNEGRIFIGVTWDAVPGDAGCNRRSRPFADELITADGDAVRDALGL